MAYVVKLELWLLAVILVCISNIGKAEEHVPEVGDAGDDPIQIVANALKCFNNEYIYSNCEESYRLTESGNLSVPHNHVDQYCNGYCLMETHLVLDCLEKIFLHFEFYNKATIQDVRVTIKAACSNGPERGNFNVAEHIKASENSAYKLAYEILLGLGLIIMVM